MKFRDYSRTWLTFIEQTRACGTLYAYRASLDCHILPVFGEMELAEIKRRDVKSFAASLLASGLKTATVKRNLAILSSLLHSALDDELISSHPGSRVIRNVGIKESDELDNRQALTRDELRHMLETSAAVTPQLTVLWFVMARTGLRVGEACVLTWGDVDFEQRLIHVHGTFVKERKKLRGVGPTKTRRTRTVQLSHGVVAALRQHQILWNAWMLEMGIQTNFIWPSDVGLPNYPQHFDKQFRKVRRAAGLGEHLTPKSLRHTFASQLLAETGATPQFVQRQLGHQNIAITVGTYGHWLPIQGSYVDALDD